MNEPVTCLIGNATGDAEVSFGASGVARCTWSLAVTPRVKRDGAWVDGEPAFYRCTAWRALGEHCGDTVRRGMRLVVFGRLSPRTYERDGQRQISLDFEVDDVGPSLLFHTATVTKAQSGSREPAYSAPIGGGDPWANDPGDSVAPF